MKRSILICLLGVVLSAVVFTVLIEADRVFVKANSPFAQSLDQFVWRNDYLYSPIVVIVVSCFVAFFDRTSARLIMACVAILPFALFQLMANSFSGRGFGLSACYVLIALGVAFLILKMQGHRVYVKNVPEG